MEYAVAPATVRPDVLRLDEVTPAETPPDHWANAGADAIAKLDAAPRIIILLNFILDFSL
jgi:hypothetical protein